MAKSQAERDAAAESRRKAAGEEELRFRVRPGILAMLADLMAWGSFSQMVELIQTMIRNVHALGPDGAAQLLAIPRHEITISESVAQRLHSEGRRESAALDRSEQ